MDASLDQLENVLENWNTEFGRCWALLIQGVEFMFYEYHQHRPVNNRLLPWGSPDQPGRRYLPCATWFRNYWLDVATDDTASHARPWWETGTWKNSKWETDIAQAPGAREPGMLPEYTACNWQWTAACWKDCWWRGYWGLGAHWLHDPAAHDAYWQCSNYPGNHNQSWDSALDLLQSMR